MKRRHTVPALLVVAAIASACGASPSPSENAGQISASPGPSLVPQDGSRCEDISYPCSRSEVDPAVLERESQYGDQLRPMLADGARDDALAWIRQQKGVVEAAANETAFMFRLEGGRPSFFFRAPPDGPPDASASALDLPDAVFASAVMPVEMSPPTHPETGVVGEGTGREMRQNGKRALFLEPWASHEIDGFADMIPQLRELPDYADSSAIVHLKNDEVSPDEFLGWDNYDAIFVKTHGGMLNGEAFVSTSIKQLLGDGDKNEICAELMSWWDGQTGIDCAEQEDWMPDATGGFIEDANGKRITVDWVVVGVQPDFFWEQYGRHGGLHRAIVYIGACDGLTDTVLARSIAGTTSAFLGWNGQPWRKTEEDASRALMRMMIEERDTVIVAHTRACDGFLCRDPEDDGAALEIFQNGPEPKMLRLYDLGTPRDPRAPDRILGDGAKVKFQGTAGDEHNDQLELVIDVIGVVDPGDSDTSQWAATLVSDESVAERYDLKVFVGDELIAAANLADEDRPTAQVTALDATTYRYTFLADLGFDVPVDGFETSLKVEVELPEGGISDYEIEVVLVEPGMGATVTIGDETWELELDAFLGGCITDTDEQITASAHVDSDLDAAGMWADLRPGLWHVEVSDPASGRTWLAAAERSHMTVLHLVPDGQSQVDELTIEDGRAWGTATFIDATAFREAWSTNGTYPSPVSGSFEIRCR